MENKKNVSGLGTAWINKRAYLFLSTAKNSKSGTFSIRRGNDGIDFRPLTSSAKIYSIKSRIDNPEQCDFFHAIKNSKGYHLSYVSYVGKKSSLCFARSKNLVDWEKIGEIESVRNARVVPDYQYKGYEIIFTGGDFLGVFASKNFEKIVPAQKKSIYINREGGEREIIVLETRLIDDGVFVLYAVERKDKNGQFSIYEIYGALFGAENPLNLLWRTPKPIYSGFNEKTAGARIFAATLFEDYFVSYWNTRGGGVLSLKHFYSHESKEEKVKKTEKTSAVQKTEKKISSLKLKKVKHNPIMTPLKKSVWESRATFNPTAFEIDGKVHIIYRAEGDGMLSVFGYATTSNGIHIDKRHPEYIYKRSVEFVKIQNMPALYTSGNNGNGGCEDPRAVLINGKIYITFTAFDSWNSIRVALASIELGDFINKKWNWKTTLISEPGKINKNWVLFPEKINGKFAILHSFYPKILIDYFENLNELDGQNNFIKSDNTRPIDYSRGWDSWFRGVGPAPLKTEDGWLVFYHAMDYRNPDRYKIGVLLLDLNDPTKILFRSKNPVLEPDQHYENGGLKWGVVYTCGAVIKDGKVFLYYGGSDEFVCVATVSLRKLLNSLKNSNDVSMDIE